MSRITIVDLEVFFHVGVPDEERAQPQRLLVTVDMEFDFTAAARSDRVARSIDYALVARTITKMGEGHSWRLIEKLATDIADRVLTEYHPEGVFVEVKKFPLPQARYVSVSMALGQFSTAFIRRTG